MNIQIANRLVELRRQNGLSQEQLAEKLGLSRQAVSKWERAESSPDTDNIIALARLYGVSLDELLDMDEESAKDEAYAQQVLREQGAPPQEAEYAAQQGTLHTWEEGGIRIEDTDVAVVDAPQDGQVHRVGFNLYAFPYPVMVVALYLILGFLFGLWHPGWMIFLTIPMYYTAIDEGGQGFNLNKVPYPILAGSIYLVIGFAWHLWHPGWLIFLTIPLYYWAESALPHLRINVPVLLGALAVLLLIGMALGGGNMMWFVLIAVLLCVFLMARRGGFEEMTQPQEDAPEDAQE